MVDCKNEGKLLDTADYIVGGGGAPAPKKKAAAKRKAPAPAPAPAPKKAAKKATVATPASSGGGGGHDVDAHCPVKGTVVGDFHFHIEICCDRCRINSAHTEDESPGLVTVLLIVAGSELKCVRSLVQSHECAGVEICLPIFSRDGVFPIATCKTGFKQWEGVVIVILDIERVGEL